MEMMTQPSRAAAPAPTRRIAIAPAATPACAAAATILAGSRGVEVVPVASYADVEGCLTTTDVILFGVDRVAGPELRRLAYSHARAGANAAAIVLMATPVVLRVALPHARELGVVECLRTPLEPAEVRLRMDAVLHARQVALGAQAASRAHHEAVARLEDAANRDPLTGLYNRRALDSRLRKALENARRFGRCLSIIVVDIDHFKAVNDGHGHTIGDVLLASVAGILRHCVRDGDIVARFGGEEFVVLAPGTDERGAAVLAERLRSTLAAAPLLASTNSGAHATLHVTASFGTATVNGRDAFDPEQMASTLLETADAALYRAKSEGRNRVVTTPAF